MAELGRTEWLEHPKSERLREWRRRTVEHREDPSNIRPLGANVRLTLASRVDGRGVRHCYCAFQATRERKIDGGKCPWTEGRRFRQKRHHLGFSDTLVRLGSMTSVMPSSLKRSNRVCVPCSSFSCISSAYSGTTFQKRMTRPSVNVNLWMSSPSSDGIVNRRPAC